VGKGVGENTRGRKTAEGRMVNIFLLRNRPSQNCEPEYHKARGVEGCQRGKKKAGKKTPKKRLRPWWAIKQQTPRRRSFIRWRGGEEYKRFR